VSNDDASVRGADDRIVDLAARERERIEREPLDRGRRRRSGAPLPSAASAKLASRSGSRPRRSSTVAVDERVDDAGGKVVRGRDREQIREERAAVPVDVPVRPVSGTSTSSARTSSRRRSRPAPRDRVRSPAVASTEHAAADRRDAGAAARSRAARSGRARVEVGKVGAHDVEVHVMQRARARGGAEEDLAARNVRRRRTPAVK
jgi:hypothetical protein